MSASGLRHPSSDVIAPVHGAELRLLASGYQGVVYLRDDEQGRVIIKSAGGSPGPLRALRRAMLRREYRIYQRLAGVAGVPACGGMVSDDHLLLEYVEGHSLRDMPLDPVDRERFFTELRDLILAVHAAGVAHGDLKRKNNILVGPGGRPYLIDFGTAISVDADAGPLRRVLFRLMCRTDLNAWIKLKYRHETDALAAEDAPYYRPTVVEGLARAVRRTWRTVTFRRWRNARK